MVRRHPQTHLRSQQQCVPIPRFQRLDSWLVLWTCLAGEAADQTLKKPQTHSGRVVAITSKTLSILDARDGDTDQFRVGEKTKVTRNGKPAKLSDVRPGDTVQVVADSIEQQLEALSIDARATE